MKNLFLVRHCKGAGEESSVPLTEAEYNQARELASYMSGLDIDVLISSPSLRAIHSLKPTASQLRKPIVLDERMEERLLNVCDLADGMKQFAQLFNHAAFEMKDEPSGLSVLSNALNKQANNVAVMTNRHEVSILLNHFGIEDNVQGEDASYIDVFVIRCKVNQLSVERVWSCGQSLELLHT
ncbi:histidine phosphatase family protein [Paenibacillus sp. SC116]|uniref:histidine phosphatase family protein n=1 Tax=Paenibacillus sp. SC116 TaxID=2968986 RepID=UPI00215A4C86|nr:histidine phosphatase family protein [Paenibacillus sp. SC116]MCR8843886.1 histidine phosphatase family protein [Paenibacillus sp. SC116]